MIGSSQVNACGPKTLASVFSGGSGTSPPTRALGGLAEVLVALKSMEVSMQTGDRGLAQSPEVPRGPTGTRTNLSPRPTSRGTRQEVVRSCGGQIIRHLICMGKPGRR
jgi:hypothetical protein